ncbi:erythrocyte membrane protein 1 [Plasmodium falciparum RAJ116]|uniref:Erythrocyte membrane protein 1 n=1 Tax=Plasmodium falciparum RAJ116 TaxID=580058 RepID=A0A0L0CT89_PLAFA|nr:erythrocyte membrane protein 1 [Plasmodium falciparum RAJ116]
MTLSSCGTTNKTMTNIAKDILEGEVSRLKARDVIDKLKEICNITTSYYINNSSSNNPCEGKDKDDNKNVKHNHKNVILSPKRQYMCTTNLENLVVDSVTRTGNNNASNTFLGDVLLASNKESQNITQYHPGVSSKDQPDVCGDVRYSFADIADIIRGTDVWSKQSQQMLLQGYLEQTFAETSVLSEINKTISLFRSIGDDPGRQGASNCDTNLVPGSGGGASQHDTQSISSSSSSLSSSSSSPPPSQNLDTSPHGQSGSVQTVSPSKSSKTSKHDSTSTAFLFYYLKKKPKLRPTKLIRVIDIPQNDYGIPYKSSTNRYVPYTSDRYIGKTYIYVEESPRSIDHYIDYYGDTTDITSSSYGGYTNDTHIYDKHDSNKLTDNEWNRLKQDFILQYFKDLPNGLNNQLPNENTIDDNMYKDIQHNDHILDVNKEEKPFITSIHDRFLENNQQNTYNI